jgi:hypothetical protein
MYLGFIRVRTLNKTHTQGNLRNKHLALATTYSTSEYLPLFTRKNITLLPIATWLTNSGQPFIFIIYLDLIRVRANPSKNGEYNPRDAP